MLILCDTVKNKTIIGLKLSSGLNLNVFLWVKNKTIIGLKSINSHVSVL